jgi:cellobiose-specific phosphotransferase system component IIA
VQQLGASVTLAVAPTDVQQTADRVSRLVVRDGGYVQSSRVQVQGSAGEANLMLKLPSGKLSAALASIEQIAPVREESQSLQDITNTYNAARQRLSDAEAERQALLHALSKAISEGEIDSLHERLSQSRSAIAHAHAALEAVSRQASTAEVEVSVLGNAHAASEGLTLHRGLHDAGRVLTVTLVVVLIAAAVLIPLALILLALMLAGRAWRRHRREQALAPQ